MVSWEMLEKIGDYAAGELSEEEVRRVERLILQNGEEQHLARSYSRMLSLLSTIGQESPEPPQEIIERAIRWATGEKVDPDEREEH